METQWYFLSVISLLTLIGVCQSDYCTTSKTVIRTRTESYTYSTTCWDWKHCQTINTRGRCYYIYCYKPRSCQKRGTRRVPYTAIQTVRSCCEGYKGCYCNIPICQGCNKGFCQAPNECKCPIGIAGDNCELDLCDANNDCYPGTCIGNGICECTSGFTGDNCLTIRGSGTLRRCSFLFQDSAFTTHFNKACGRDENEVVHKYYTNIKLPYWFVASYEVFYEIPDDNPAYPSYIEELAVGLISSKIQVLLRQGSSDKWREDIQCVIATKDEQPNVDKPYVTMSCNDTTRWESEVTHGDTMTLTVHTESGGFKKFLNQGQKETRYYAGTQFEEDVMEIVFDFEPPTQCIQTLTCTEDEQYPLEVSPEISRAQDGKIQLGWSGWSDADSGLGTFTYTVYHLVPNDSGRLVEGEAYLPATIWTSDTLPDITLRTPGLYSVILEVSDDAGNTVKARSLILYDPIDEDDISSGSRIDILEDHPLDIPGAELIESIYWLVGSVTNLQISWADRYINRFLHDNKILNGLEPQSDLLDDEYGTLKSDSVENEQGITSYGIYISESSNIPSSEEYTSISVNNPTYNYPNPIADGDVVYIFILASDILQNVQAEIITLGVDGSPAKRQGDLSLSKNDDSVETDFPFKSSVSIPIVDGESGILRINFTIIDTTDPLQSEVTIVQSSQTGQRHPVHTTDADCDRTGECYCASVGGCFTNIQKVWLNNCWFDKREGHAFKMEYIVLNGAGKETEGEFNLHVLDDIAGLEEYPAPSRLRHVTYSNNVYKVALTWEYEPSCYTAVKVYYIYTTHVKEFIMETSPNNTRQDIDGLRPLTTYRIEMYIEYAGGKTSERVSMEFTTLTDGYTPDSPSSGGLSGGAIAGIVIGVLILLVLIAVVVLLLVRRKQEKPMVPSRVREAGRSIRHRFSHFGGGLRQHSTGNDYTDGSGGESLHINTAYDNANYNSPLKAAPPLGKPPPYESGSVTAFKVAYVGEEDDDIYTYGEMKTEDNAIWKVSNDKLVIGNDLPDAKGRFADLKLATLRTSSGSKTVVAKMNKVGASQNDILLMTAKMNFLATAIPQNDNLLQFVAAIPPPDGPMILVEYCEEGKLSEWLQKQKKITGEVEDLMVNFSIQVAAGMTSLHEAGILHRRLGARNILLTRNKTKQIVAKVTGFGPMKGEQTGSSAKGKEKAPFKWMAPEQYDVEKLGRIYTPKTDVWSYAILLHEIYSKGELPYPDMTVPDMKTNVRKGYRMPKSERCPDFVYDDIMSPSWEHNPEDRPQFGEILTSLKRFFDSGVTQGEYTYD